MVVDHMCRMDGIYFKCIPFGEYQLRFFLRENFMCPCRIYLIETKCHILYECRRFNNYWNPRRNIINLFVSFLEYNLNAFFFSEGIT